jgi:hypothetical protein
MLRARDFSGIRTRFLRCWLRRERSILVGGWHGICIGAVTNGRKTNGRGIEMNRHQQRVVLLFSLLLISAALLGCANNPRSEASAAVAYEEYFDRARASIAEAQRAGAEEHGRAQLTLAREKLRAAEEAVEDGESERARRLAVEAELDADLALAIARNQQTQALVAEVQSGLRTLEEQLRRSEGAGFDRP